MTSRTLYDFSDFIQKIQDEGNVALREMRIGKKGSHWIWYFFPQLECLGVSYDSKYYGIKSLEETEMFLRNEFLREFLITITKTVKVHLDKEKKVTKIFGCIDNHKFLSCMTLFYYGSKSLEEKGVNHNCKELFRFCMEYTEKELKKKDTKTIELCEKSLKEIEAKKELECELSNDTEVKSYSIHQTIFDVEPQYDSHMAF